MISLQSLSEKYPSPHLRPMHGVAVAFIKLLLTKEEEDCLLWYAPPGWGGVVARAADDLRGDGYVSNRG